MKRPLQELLSVDPSAVEETDISETPEQGEDQRDPDERGLCIECGDQPAELDCLNCKEAFCQVCFDYIHRTGKRKEHKTEKKDVEKEVDVVMGEDQNDVEQRPVHNHTDEVADTADEDRVLRQVTDEIIATRGDVKAGDHLEVLRRIKEHCRFVPMRLTIEERKLLRLLEAALNVSEYTDKVDIIVYSSKAKRMVAQLKEMCSILAGLVVATNMKTGQNLLQDKDFSANAEWYKTIFEIGRRYKIMNPEKMRDSFGKLMYMMMDSRLPEVKEAMDFDLYKPINTVHSYLEQREALEMMDDPLVLQAVVEIIPNGKKQSAIQMEIKRKERAIEQLASKYSQRGIITKEEIRQCLYSIGDYHAYLRANCRPVEEMIQMLDDNFDPDQINGEFSLGISLGRQGARLSHNHYKQYHYVKQSLTLWSQIMRDMFMLWTLADHDLVSDHNRYRLADTGQGLNRIKPCPHLSRAMHGIIRKCQQRTGTWIGSSVVHLGDHAVPNALFFLDKYLQVPRILNPVYIVLSDVDRLVRDPFVNDWVCAQFHSPSELKTTILCDFFKHAFDGSGADNYFDAGSCIDGRLTSAWNWANSISKKPYYKQFLISGFTGFNGSEGF
ncbi:hypothetical protein TRICI_001619 [Trichomonascus ciferrii]|uniref:Non-canonical E2 ubiquitin-conjugating enzyme C-terminal domain-containing protein n=1 Tax=Trichomonascus ciferrii TaxID=44093 RepID=A0A642V804_9ASCO|nr:hypothetical protein TRICI_001619 [Trichomonascus ciferrii]